MCSIEWSYRRAYVALKVLGISHKHATHAKLSYGDLIIDSKWRFLSAACVVWICRGTGHIISWYLTIFSDNIPTLREGVGHFWLLLQCLVFSHISPLFPDSSASPRTSLWTIIAMFVIKAYFNKIHDSSPLLGTSRLDRIPIIVIFPYFNILPDNSSSLTLH